MERDHNSPVAEVGGQQKVQLTPIDLYIKKFIFCILNNKLIKIFINLLFDLYENVKNTF